MIYGLIDFLFSVTLKIEKLFGKARIGLYKFYDSRIDRKYKIDTLSIPETTYIPMSIKILKWVFRKYITIENIKFFDYGSGKGKALILASELGVKYLGGIEWSADLVEISKSNLITYKELSKKDIVYDIQQGDATLYGNIDEYNVFLFNNTFGGNPSEVRMVARVLKIIRESLDRNNREVFIIYVHPAKNLRQLFDSYEWLEDKQEIRNKFRPIYDNAYICVFHIDNTNLNGKEE